MHSFCQIASGHVHPLLIIELLQIKGKEILAKIKCHNKDGGPNETKISN
jgi:hypothetical protein